MGRAVALLEWLRQRCVAQRSAICCNLVASRQTNPRGGVQPNMREYTQRRGDTMRPCRRSPSRRPRRNLPIRTAFIHHFYTHRLRCPSIGRLAQNCLDHLRHCILTVSIPFYYTMRR